MKCITATMDGTTEIAMDLFIKRPVRRSGHGLRCWLGYPFAVRADVGQQNQGRSCDFVEVADQFPVEKPAGNREEEVRISRCSVDNGGLAGRARLIPETSDTDSGYVVLLRIVHRPSAGKADPVIKFEASPHQLAEGYVIDYGRVAFSRHPNRFINTCVEERLLRLNVGESYRFYAIEPEARVLGRAIHNGRRIVYEVKAEPNGVRISKVSVEPLAVPAFDSSSLSNDLVALLLCLLFGIMCGVVALPASVALWLQFVVGIGVGVVLCALALAVRYLVAMNTAPTYGPVKPY